MLKADLILYNGKILQMNGKGLLQEAVAIKDGKILDVGKNSEIKDYMGHTTEVIDLKGRTAVPGFIDSHVHLVPTGLNALGLNLKRVKSIKDILNLIKKKLETPKNGDVIWGVALDELSLKEKKLPTRYDLDSIAPEIPVFISRVEYHTIVVNSCAFHKINLPFNLEGIEKDSRGLPTGRLHHHASSIARKKLFEMIPEEKRQQGVELAINQAIRRGVTTVVAMEGGFLFHDNHAELLIKHKASLPIDIELFYQTTDINKVISYNLPRIGGCIFLDGSFGSRSAALFEPYQDMPQCQGNLYFTQEEVDEFVIKAHEKKLQIAMHAIGGRAIQQVLTAYEKALSKIPRRDHRHRIEHFELPTDDQIKKARELGIIVSVQPAYEYMWGWPGGMYEIRLGKERCKRANPFKKLIDSGLLLAGGSDSDVTPINPLLGIHSAANHPHSESKITPYQALKMFTINGATAIFQEKSKGTIERGKIADIAVLENNPLEVDTDAIKDIKVDYTIKNGKILYAACGAEE